MSAIYEISSAERWQNQDDRHGCSYCAHVRGDYRNGFRCDLLEENLRREGRPEVMVCLPMEDGDICNDYECNEDEFYRHNKEYPGQHRPDDFGVTAGKDYPGTLYKRPTISVHGE